MKKKEKERPKPWLCEVCGKELESPVSCCSEKCSEESLPF